MARRKTRNLDVVHPEMMKRILETFSFLDRARWNQESNYETINFCRSDLTDDEKLLTHWLCYITDRQMKFQSVWDKHGYVISHMVLTYTRGAGKDIWNGVFCKYLNEKNGKFRLECLKEGSNEILSDWHDITDAKVSFASRYMTSDLVLIYCTLRILDKIAERSMARFICKALSNGTDLKKEIKQIACALDQLTYAHGSKIPKIRRKEDIRNHCDEKIRRFKFEKGTERSPFKANGGRKRLWCALRDYLKHPYLNTIFVRAIKEAGYDNYHKLVRNSPELKAALSVLELPGDVWNNSTTFRRWLFEHHLRPDKDKPLPDMPRTIRMIIDIMSKNNPLEFYPEQLDVSFDFVPRMCEHRMCEICLFGAGTKKLCHQDENLLCPIILFSCGYKYRCKPGDCVLKENRARLHCNNPITIHKNKNKTDDIPPSKSPELSSC